MTGPVFTIRPEPGCSATVAAGLAAGLEMVGYPLFEIRPLAWDAPAPDLFDALLIGSANALRHGGAGLDRYRAMPVHAVGPATARAAEAAGFAIAGVGEGRLQPLVDALPPMKLLRLAGAERVPISPPDGVTVETRAVYESAPLPLPEEMAERLRGGGLALLHSAAAARHFARQCDSRSVGREGIALAALAPRIAAAAGEGWRAVHVAPEPGEAALLALARELCHEPPPEPLNAGSGAA